jgi:hypothetical protein
MLDTLLRSARLPDLDWPLPWTKGVAHLDEPQIFVRDAPGYYPLCGDAA